MPTSLPDDVVSEILSWAPVKSACRFRCVSKGWCALISDPAFLAAHKARTEPQLLLVANFFHGEARAGRRDLRLLDTADGSVVRVIKGVGDLQTITSDSGVPVCTTRIDQVLNVIDLATGNVLMTSRVYQFAPFGIGYAAPSGAWKMVRLGHHTCEVLTSSDDARRWRPMQSPPFVVRRHRRLRRNHQNSVVTIDGVMYLLYSLESPYLAYSSKPQHVEDHVLCLDLESEQWKGSIKTPLSLREMRSSTTSMVELNGTLCIVHTEGRGSKHACTTVWLLSDLSKGLWVVAYVIPMDQTMDLVTPFWVMRHGGKLMCHCYTGSASPTLQVYDSLNETFTRLVDPPGNHLADTGFCDMHLECYVRRI